MASANVSLVDSIVEAWRRGDFGWTAWADPQIEWIFADGPSPGVWTGLSGMKEGFREFLRAWDDWHVEYSEDYTELDREHLLVLVGFGGRGKTSGVELSHLRATGAIVFRVRSGKVVRLVQYWDRERAYADFPLTPEGEHS